MKVIGIGSENGIRLLRRVDKVTTQEAIEVYREWMKTNSLELSKWESLNELVDDEYSHKIPQI